VRARCADGPFVGKTLEFPTPWHQLFWAYHWKRAEYVGRVGPLMWIHYGRDKHCYQLVQNTYYGDWRLVFRDTF
jgi:hypothetical protein